MTRRRARIRWSKDAELLRLGAEHRKLLRRYHETLIAACLKSATAPEEAQWIGRYPYPAAMPPDDYTRYKAATKATGLDVLDDRLEALCTRLDDIETRIAALPAHTPASLVARLRVLWRMVQDEPGQLFTEPSDDAPPERRLIWSVLADAERIAKTHRPHP
ncbi:hypothetical protein M2352_000733 [Azospirillum fermentarium]|uniref:hypothetical protein n=1 Tax=Azospirillum fermentarium TaxID=1233114 RepID=UPI002226E568|nr:hypothetical protein [Azospirillum fermentarium]MCW2245142.1 hypothetical protein [Azospirillum fermentarium]